MRILVESGATKSEWRILGTPDRFFLGGTNVSSMNIDAVKAIISEGLEKCLELSGASIGEFHLYTAGVLTEAIRKELGEVVRGFSPDAVVEIQEDIIGAARGALGREKGIVAIMGTGSNAFFWDGKEVSRNVYSGGFILGDDGSASVLGKLFLSDWIKFRVPADVARDFSARFDGSYASIVNNVYHSDAPSRYLGSLAPFIMEHYPSSEYVRNLVDGHIDAFARKSILAYNVAEYPVGVVGGFGYACRETVSRIFSGYGIRINGFVPAPIDGLENYHLEID